ncbi:MAG: tripartite tricarboxylate transporter substrate binding protein [Acetobacteraceae bacterium]|nr:tripartite tricarboxylate transporter substrate binding protein [Acetobacteraceae bacterium]
MIRRRPLLALASAAPAAARAQTGFPARPLRIIVPFPAGGAADLTARLVGERMGASLGQPVVVENRAGAGGNIAAEATARATPDGHTLFLGGATILLANRHLYRGAMPFDTWRDLAHISRVSVGSTLLVVNANRPWRTVQELVAAAKAQPGRITTGSSGIGTISHLTISKFMKTAGTELNHVPYRGLAPGLNDLLAGTIDMLFDGMPALMPHVREGRLRALLAGSQERITYVPGIETVPGIRETFPGADMDMSFWYSIQTTAGSPPEAIRRLHAATLAAARDPDYGSRLSPLGFTAIWDESPEAFLAYMRAQEPVWRDLVEVSGARLE